MRLFIDDTRMPKTWGWLVCSTYADAIHSLEKFWDKIDEISVDNDLGEVKEGYDIAKWIEERIELDGWKPIPKMYCHSANPVAMKNIMSVFNKYNKE